MRQTVVFDFDGVIHSYTSGWQGETCIPDPPVAGIQEAIHSIHEAGYEVVIVSTRCSTLRGRMAIESWLDMYQMTQDVDRVCKEKPPAIVYIDDRAICFDGHPENLLSKIKAFKPWNKKAPTIDPESLRPQWIPVTERVPGTERVLVTDGESVIKAARRFDGVWRMEQLICKPITHWMPLPEPPTNGVAERK